MHVTCEPPGRLIVPIRRPSAAAKLLSGLGLGSRGGLRVTLACGTGQRLGAFVQTVVFIDVTIDPNQRSHR